MMNNKLEAYRYADTMGKSPLDLIITVYDGALKALRMAAEHYRSEKNQDGYDEIQKTKRMVTHLYSTLDTEKGGQVATNEGPFRRAGLILVAAGDDQVFKPSRRTAVAAMNTLGFDLHAELMAGGLEEPEEAGARPQLIEQARFLGARLVE